MKTWIAGLGVLLLLLGGGGAYLIFSRQDARPPADASQNWFDDVTDEAGVDFVHDAGDLSQWQVWQIMGSGVAVFDFDGDGLLDLYLLNGSGPESKWINRLYKNMSKGKFKDVTAGSGLGIAGINTGVIVGDVNNDGLPDVVVTQIDAVKLFLNRGQGVFEDVTQGSGLHNPLWGTSANLFDFDRDGWLDLVIANYVEYDPSKKCDSVRQKREYCGPGNFPGTVSRLFRNLGGEGKGVRFRDVTIQAGLAKAPGPGLGVYCADYDGDGWPDFFIANDNRPNHLWMNQRNGTFLEQAYLRGVALDAMGLAQSGMGVAVGDVDGDGLFDIYVTHLNTELNTLWQQGPKRGQFADRTGRAGLINTDWHGTGFGTLMADFNGDGWLDIVVANGAISAGSTTPHPPLGDHFMQFSERNQLFRNEGKGRFRDVSKLNPTLCGTPNIARALACGDLDGDGALDLVLSTVGNRARILRNVAKDRGHWLIVQAFDPRLNRDAYGAEIRLHVGEQSMLRIINPGDSFQSSSDPRAHFGLGKATRYDAIDVVWPDGLAEVFPGDEANRVRKLRRGEGKPRPAADSK